MKLKITSIESYADFSERCRKAQEMMTTAKDLGINHLMTIEGLVYAYAQALITRKEYDELSLEEKQKRHENNIKLQAKLLEFETDLKRRPIDLRKEFDIDKFLTNQK